MAAQLTAVHDWVPPVQPLPVQGVGSSRTNKLFLKLFLIALAALAVHGYHLGVDDAEIYVPAVKKVADPALFPFSSNEFFLTHAHLSLFSDLVGNFARWTHVPVDL